MPCQDYSLSAISHSYQEDKSRRDMLARIACKAMYELEANGMADLLLLRDDEVREWWEQHKIDDAKAAKRKAAAEKRKQIKESLKSKT